MDISRTTCAQSPGVSGLAKSPSFGVSRAPLEPGPHHVPSVVLDELLHPTCRRFTAYMCRRPCSRPGELVQCHPPPKCSTLSLTMTSHHPQTKLPDGLNCAEFTERKLRETRTWGSPVAQLLGNKHPIFHNSNLSLGKKAHWMFKKTSYLIKAFHKGPRKARQTPHFLLGFYVFQHDFMIISLSRLVHYKQH